MAFSRAFLLAVFAFTLVVAQDKVTLKDFSGVWKSTFDISNVNILTPQGPGVVCRDELSPECEEEISLTEDTYIFNGTTLAIEVRERIGITTVEEAAAVHPECAEDGLYPVERVIMIPQSQIIFYNQKTDRIYFIDPRRPDDINCLGARYRIGEDGRPYIDINHSEFFQGTAPDVFARGFSFRCGTLPQSCSVDASDDGELDMAFQNTLTLTCVDGDCLNVHGAMPSSP